MSTKKTKNGNLLNLKTTDVNTLLDFLEIDYRHYSFKNTPC